ncbi:ABC transporter permease [Acetobacter musti]|nr:ABC transporter permease [Acetobacter musti]
MLPVTGVIVFIVLWWFAIRFFHIKPYIAPSPDAVAATLFNKRWILLQNLWPTAVEAICGFLLGNGMAIVVATVFVHSRTLERAFFPIMVLLNSVPVVAKAPILVLLLGNGLAPKIGIAAIVCFFPTLVNMARGLESVNPQALELMHVLSATRGEVFTRLRLPTAVPYLFSALKVAASTSVVGAIVGEWIGSQYGIGALIIQATYNFDSRLLYATVICGSVLSVLFFSIIRTAERVCARRYETRER